MIRPTSRAAGAIASVAALAALAGPMTVSASAALPPAPLPQPVQQALPPLPPAVQQAVTQLLALAPNSPIPSSVSAPIVMLLGQAASTPGVPSQAADAVSQLAAALSSPNPPSAAQVAADLRSIALTPGLPSQVSSQLNSLADAFDGGSGSNGSGSNGAYGSNGSGSNGASGSNGSGSNGANGTNGSGSIAGFAAANPFGPGFNPRGVTASGRSDSRAVRASGAVIKSVRYNAKRHKVYVVVACRAKTTPCNTAVAVYQGRRQATTPIARTIARQRRAMFTMRVSAPAARTLAKRGGMLRAVAVSNTPYGQAHSAKSIHVKRGRH